MIVNTNKIPSDEKTRKIIIEALEMSVMEFEDKGPTRKYKQHQAVLLVLKTDQKEMPF